MRGVAIRDESCDLPAELWSAPVPARSSSAGAPAAASVWPAAAAGSTAPGSGCTGWRRGQAGGRAPVPVPELVPAAAGQGQAAEKTPPQTGDMTRSQGQRTTGGLV